jgi:hypothetical protein
MIVYQSFSGVVLVVMLGTFVLRIPLLNLFRQAGCLRQAFAENTFSF